MPCADLRWERLPYIISKLNKFGFREEEVENLSNKGRCNLLGINLVVVAITCHYKDKIFFKEIILDGLLGKTKYYAIQIEIQERLVHVTIFLYGFPMHQIF